MLSFYAVYGSGWRSHWLNTNAAANPGWSSAVRPLRYRSHRRRQAHQDGHGLARHTGKFGIVQSPRPISMATSAGLTTTSTASARRGQGWADGPSHNDLGDMVGRLPGNLNGRRNKEPESSLLFTKPAPQTARGGRGECWGERGFELKLAAAYNGGTERYLQGNVSIFSITPLK